MAARLSGSVMCEAVQDRIVPPLAACALERCRTPATVMLYLSFCVLRAFAQWRFCELKNRFFRRVNAAQAHMLRRDRWISNLQARCASAILRTLPSRTARKCPRRREVYTELRSPGARSTVKRSGSASNHRWRLASGALPRSQGYPSKSMPVARRVLGENHDITPRQGRCSDELLLHGHRRHARRPPRGSDDDSGHGPDRAARFRGRTHRPRTERGFAERPRAALRPRSTAGDPLTH